MKSCLQLITTLLLLGLTARLAAIAEPLTPSGDTTGATDHNAITIALSGGGTVELGEGTFYVNAQIVLDKAVTLKGAGRDKTRIEQIKAHTTANAEARVLKLTDADAVVEGVTVAKGYVYQEKYGAGILVEAGTVRDCRITDCETTQNSGGALAIMGANGLVTRTIIDENYNANSYAYCPGVYLTAGVLECSLVLNNRLTGNEADKRKQVAGGLWFRGGGTARNCTVTGNYGRGVGGVTFYDGFNWYAGFLQNCIVANNTASTYAAGGTCTKDWNSNILTTSRFDHCLFSEDTTVPNDTCLAADPGFKGKTDWHLSSVSEARGKADYASWMSGLKDLDLVDFPSSGKVDLGCYQYVASASFTCEIDVSAETLFLGDSVRLTAVLEPGTDPSNYIFSWTVGESAPVAGAYVDVTPTTPGTYDVTLVVSNDTATTKVFETETLEAFTVYQKTISIATKDDIAAAFADLVDGQEVVFTDVGEYEFTDQVQVSAGVTIRGQGRDKTILKMRSGANKRFFVLNHPSAILKCVTLTGGGGRETNVKFGDGGGVLIGVDGGIVEDCRITDCHSGMNDAGMAVCIQGAAGRVSRCLIDNNTSATKWASGGAVTLDAGSIDNCLVCSNAVENGSERDYYVPGGIYLRNGGVVSNCTVVANVGCGLGGIGVNGLSGARVVNCIACGNRAEKSVKGGVLPDLTDWSGTDANLVTSLVSPEASPFRDDTVGDYRLGVNSAAKETGVYVTDMETMTDLVGNARVRNGKVDMGCYENLGYDDWIDIEGEPARYGVVSPAYGVKDGLASGTKVTLSVIEKPTGDDAPVFGGWRIENAAGETLSSGKTESLELTHDGVYCKVIWIWYTKFPITATTAGGGAVSVSKALANYGDEVTITAIPDPSVPGVVFWKWEGDVPESSKYDNPYVFEVKGATSVTAVFGAATTYVASTDTPNEGARAPYTSPETAANSIADAMNVTVDGGSVLLLEGAHDITQTVNVARNLRICGRSGAAATTVRNVATSGTVRRVFELNHANALVEGVTITGGYAYNVHGAGALIDTAGGTIRHCRVVACTSSMNCNGAVALLGKAARLSTTIVACNTNESNYGNCPGVYASVGAVDSCLVVGNVVKDCSARKVAIAGGMLIEGGTVSNCTVSANIGRGVGGITFWNGYNWGVGKLVNTISFGNTASNPEYLPAEGQGDVNWQCDKTNKLVNCRFTDPKFVDAEKGDYHLDTTGSVHDKGAASPAVNDGVYGPWMSAATDLDGKPRVKRSRRNASGEVIKAWVDLGCYESTSTAQGAILLIK